MDETRKMWASAAVVGVIVVGGATVAAAASAGRLDQVARDTRAVVEQTRDDSPADSPAPDEGIVVSTEVNPHPGEVLEYWDNQRMAEAQPMPIPEITIGESELAE
ncbi:hypothetical protein SAMN05421874_12555 [Nonomuraea maritima]|uniref:Uncharacterized protein n=1 Tax=Nonomuraea maritima TaxID=683260 RepID=A0A1G9LLL0_9ACTN|nr:hypothetical protein [Nonomuraea maritima]SDL62713.1 hypothetical protein SAMN05421874_12555 [Nonomuraea maritima]